MKHKMWSRLLSMALAVMMIASIVPNSAFAEAGSELAASSQVVTEMVEETEEVAQPEETTGEEPAEQPAGEPAPTAEPVAEPTAEPVTESEQPTAEPTQAPVETAVPSEQPSAEPSAAPEGTQTPEGTEAPEGTAVPSETPAASATPAPSESPVPSETPAPSEEPAIDGQALLDELMAIEDDEAFLKAVSELTEEQTAALEALGEEALADYALRVETLTVAQQQEEKFTELYEKLMAAETADEIEALLGALSEEEGMAFSDWLDDEKNTALTDKLNDLGLADTIEYGPAAKNYSNAGPLLVPITIDANSVSSLKRVRSSASVADDKLLDVNEIITNKTVTDISTENESKYRIQLEAYTTGEVTSGEISVPSDIVLVLDESGSMDYSIGSGPVYSGELDTSKTYYMINGNNSQKIQYSTRRNSWGYTSWGRWVSITPTTGPEDSNTEHIQLYTGITSRKNAIINAVNGFLDQVKADNQNLPEDVTPHRVGIIGFSEGGWFSAAARVIRGLETSLDHLNSNDLKASNGTYVDAGLDLVDDVFNRGNSQVTGQTRNRVVVVFTDGNPGTGDWDDSASKECAADAINTAKTLKNTYGATVFSVGIFNGADPSDTNGLSNQFMNALSSNYKSATASYANGRYTVNLGNRETSGDYYLSASNTDTLNEIFEKIADQTTNPSITLKNASVVDEVEQYFALPSSTSDVTVQVQKATAGGGFEGPLTPADGVQVEFDGQKVIVKGYDFDQHYVTTEAKPGTTNDYGEKLVITFEITPEKEFWGGNKVPTNVTASSGVFAEVNGENKLLENFPKPAPVDVPLKEITLTGKEVNVYYSGETPDAANLVNQITVPDNWTTDYVNRTIEYELVAEGTVSNETDGEYGVKATLKPLYDGTEGPTYASATGSVKVYKPELTWKDTTMNSGTVLTDVALANQLVNKTWKYGEKEHTQVSMFGREPALDYVFHANNADGIVLDQTQLTDETNVYVAVTSNRKNLNGVTTFIRMRGEQCPGDCTATAGGNVVENTTHFCIHLDNGELTIEKTVTKWNNAKGNDAAFVFKIEGGGNTYYCTIDLSTNKTNDSETITLPAGTYTVTELPTSGYKLDNTVEGNDQERSVVVSGNAGEPVVFTNTSDGDKIPGDNSSVLNKWIGGLFQKVTSEAANG